MNECEDCDRMDCRERGCIAPTVSGFTAFCDEPNPVTAPLFEERDALRAENERLRDVLEKLLVTVDSCKMMEIGAGGMSIDAQLARSVYLRVPVSPFEEARIALETQENVQ